MRSVAGFLLLLLLLRSLTACAYEEYYDGESDDTRRVKFSFHDTFFNTTKNMQLLSDLMLPLRVMLYSSEGVNALCWELVFMDKKRGVCPRPGLWELVEELLGERTPVEEKYGTSRLEAMQVLFRYNATQYSIHNNSEMLGFIGVMLAWDSHPVWVHATELVAYHNAGQSISLGVDAAAVSRREKRWTMEMRVGSQRLNIENVNREIRYEHTMAIERDRRLLREKEEEKHRRKVFLEELREFRKHDGEIIKKHRVASGNTVEDGRLYYQKERRIIRCENVRHALKTLRSQVPSAEPRMQYLAGREKEMCGGSPADEGVAMTSVGTCDVRCPSYCDGVKTLEEWAAHSGSSNSVVQLHALYHNVLMSDSDSNEEVTEEYFSLLRRLVMEDVDRGVFSTCGDVCIPSPSLRREMTLFAGLIALLDDDDDNNATSNTVDGEKSDRVSGKWWFGATKAFLRIWEAAHFGSIRALRILATMKEHGILTPQQGQVSLMMLRSSLAQDGSYFWKTVMESVLPEREKYSTVSAEKLLKKERFFGIHNSWSIVNEPYLTRYYVQAIVAEVDALDEYQEDVTSSHQPLRSLERSIFRARLFVAGIKGAPRDLQRAECLLLTVLRKLEYMCDVTHPSSDDESHFSQNGRGGGCYEHIEQLQTLRYGSSNVGRCDLHLVVDGVPSASTTKTLSQFYKFVRPRKIRLLLKETLLLLSYVQVLNGVKMELAAKYAFLSIQLSAAAFQKALADIPPAVKDAFHAANRSAKHFSDFLKRKNSPGASLLAHALRRRGPRDGLADLTRSGFPSSEDFLLLAVAAPAVGEEGERLMRVVAESFYGTPTCTEEANHTPCRTQLSFFLLREAARLWRDEKNSLSIFEKTYSLSHSGDAFFLMASLLRSGNISVSDIRHGKLFSRAVYAPSVSHVFRPTAVDTDITYVAKLNEFLRRTPLSPVWRSMSVNHRDWEQFAESWPTLRELQVTRFAVQRSLHEHDILPLLIVSDMHDYLDETRWSGVQRFFRDAWDSISLLFTKSRSETLEEEFARGILKERRGIDTLSSIAEGLAGSVTRSHFVRQSVIALQLLALAMNSGEPDGFSILLSEEMARQNRHLRSLAVLLTEHIWSHSSLMEVWTEEHKAAQWHALKPKTRGYGAVLSVNPRASFDYAFPESRLDLFTQIIIKRVASRCTKLSQRGASASFKDISTPQRIDKEFVEELALCSGVLVSDALKRRRQFPPQEPYNGMYFPVASSLCLRQLLTHVQLTNDSPFPGINAEEFEIWLLEALVNLTAMQSRYYGISIFGGHRDSSSDEMEGDNGRFQKRLVEPWRRGDYGDGSEMWVPDVGEGAFYNKRLHSVSGTFLGAHLQLMYKRGVLWMKRMLNVV
uniref:Uncharacterized protein n=1 Tax=Trypanosoma congolense (strain IL3000) TaxID=1068625 RepID=G0UWC5_TRYCI|nr:conserved hypothetical protein [Trypanosoma congolense IL3000]